MKKLICTVLVLIMVFSLTACDTTAVIQGLENLAGLELPELPQVTEAVSEAGEESPVQEPEETPAPAPATAPASLPNKVIVSISKTRLSHYAPDNAEQLILNFDYDTPIVSIEGNDAAAHAINDFTAYLEEEHYTGMEGDQFTGYGYYGMLEQAEDNYRYVHDSGAELPIEFSSSRVVDVLRADSSVLSLVYSDYIYAGGESGFSVDKAYVFSTESGLRLEVGELAADSEALVSTISGFVAEQMQNDAELSELLIDKSFSALLSDDSWYLSEQGFVVILNYSDFGSEKDGCVSFTVPYTQLNGIIDTKWMPQIIDSPCSFSLTDTPAEGTEIYDMVNIDEDGQVFYLLIDGMANQLKIASVLYADSFYETAEHWYGSYAGNCAIQICATIPEGMPNLMISCTDVNGVVHNMLVSQSGIDGALILTDDSIEAVG